MPRDDKNVPQKDNAAAVDDGDSGDKEESDVSGQETVILGDSGKSEDKEESDVSSQKTIAVGASDESAETTEDESSGKKTALFSGVRSSEESASLVGHIIDERYKVIRWLGEGAMGQVYEAKHLHLDKRIALKVLHEHVSSDKGLAARFKREAKTCSALEHPNCIGVTDFGEVKPGRFYLVMEYVEGKTLTELLDAGLIDRMTAFEVTREILVGLEHAHGAGIIHRDIKLDNVMRIQRDDGTWQIKILDFGLAKALGSEKKDPRLTRAGLVVGTPNYMAPEQIADRNVDGRADLYAVGILLFRMLVGRPIFPGDTPVEVVQAKLRDSAPTVKELAPHHSTPSLEGFLKKALKRDPKERFDDARQMREALERIIDEENSSNVLSASFRRWYFGAGEKASWGRRLLSLVTTKEGVLILGAVLIFGFVVSFLAFAALRGEKNEPSNEPSMVSMIFKLDEPPQAPESLKDPFLQVEVLLEKEACAKALEVYDGIRSEAESVAKGRYLEGRIAACLGKKDDALKAYGHAVDLDSRYKDDPRILESAEEMLRTPKKRDAAMAFLQDKLGEAALPTLIEMAGHHPNKRLREQAQAAVEKLGAGARIDAVAALEWKLRQTYDCKEKKQIVSQIGEVGGPKAAAALRRARDAKVKDGLFSEKYVYACVRKHIIDTLKRMHAQ